MINISIKCEDQDGFTECADWLKKLLEATQITPSTDMVLTDTFSNGVRVNVAIEPDELDESDESDESDVPASQPESVAYG